jgi:hypothetical protein
MSSSWIFIVIIALLLLWTFSRRRRPRSNKLDTAMAILSDIDNNLKVMEARLKDNLSKKNFKIGNWRFYKDKLEFLEPELVTTINEAFTISEDFKNKIDVAKKSNNMALIQDLPVEQLKEPLTKSRKGVVAWLRANVNTEMQTDRRRNWLGF